MAVAGDIARAAGAGADRPQCLCHRREHRRMLPHAEIVVRAPHGDLGADAVIEGARKPAAAPLEIGEDTVPPFGAQRREPLLEESFVIHRSPQSAEALTYTIYLARQVAAREARRCRPRHGRRRLLRCRAAGPPHKRPTFALNSPALVELILFDFDRVGGMVFRRYNSRLSDFNSRFGLRKFPVSPATGIRF